MTRYDAVLMRSDMSTQEFEDIPERMLIDLLKDDEVVDADIRYHEPNCQFSHVDQWPWLIGKLERRWE